MGAYGLVRIYDANDVDDSQLTDTAMQYFSSFTQHRLLGKRVYVVYWDSNGHNMFSAETTPGDRDHIENVMDEFLLDEWRVW